MLDVKTASKKMGTRPKDMFKKFHKKESVGEPRVTFVKRSRRSSGTLANPRTGKVKPEKKNIDASISPTFVLASGTAVIAALNVGATEGASPTQHIGRKITMTSLSYRFNISLPSSTTSASSVRYLVVYDRQTNAALPATTAIMQTDNHVGFMNLANSKRFVVLVDEYINDLEPLPSGSSAAYRTGYRKLNLPVEYNETNGGTIADITTGGVYVLIWGNFTGSIANGTFASRIRYTDI